LQRTALRAAAERQVVGSPALSGAEV